MKNMMLEKVATGDHVTAQFVKDRRITVLTIQSEGKFVTFETNGKSVERVSLDVDYQGRADGDPNTWTLNNKSRNALIDTFGPDSTKWVGRQVEIKLDGVGEYEHIMVDTMRTG